MKPVSEKNLAETKPVGMAKDERGSTRVGAVQGGLRRECQPECTTDEAVVPVWKRVLDVTLIMLFSPVLIPVMCATAVFIKIVSRGPVILHQDRIGFMGRRFTCLKFRTMHCDADTSVHEKYTRQLAHEDVPMTKPEDFSPVVDSKVIRFGGLLRAMGIDELPQLINVLRGEMSLVGPRPCMQYEYEEYEPWHMERFRTLPGLTGLWQVNGKNRTTFRRMMELDIEYVRTKSLWLDLKILLRTVPTIVGQVLEKLRAKMGAPSVGDAGGAVPGQARVSVEGEVTGGRPVSS